VDKELELARLQLEKIKVAAARAEMDFRIKQANADIRRLQDQITNQLKREAELEVQIQQAVQAQ
jgi:hypothetical protein